jgi:hypothetical protein
MEQIGGEAIRLTAALRSTLERRNELFQTQTENPAESAQFNHIDAPFAALAFADEWLRLSDFRCELDLRESCAPPRISKSPEEYSVFGGMNRFLHCARRRNGLG